MKLLFCLALILSFSFISLAQEQPKEEPKPQDQAPPPPKKKSLSMDMNDVKPVPVEDKPVEKPKIETEKKDADKSETGKDKKDEATLALEEVEAALLAHKSFLNTVGSQSLVTFINHMNTTLKDDQKFLLREKPLKQFIEVQQRLAECRNLWGEYFTALGKEINADVNKNYKLQRECLEYMQSCKNAIIYNVSISDEIIKQYKKKNEIK